MDIFHIWMCRYPKSHIDNHPFRYLYKSMDIHTKVTIPDVTLVSEVTARHLLSADMVKHSKSWNHWDMYRDCVH